MIYYCIVCILQISWVGGGGMKSTFYISCRFTTSQLMIERGNVCVTGKFISVYVPQNLTNILTRPKLNSNENPYQCTSVKI